LYYPELYLLEGGYKEFYNQKQVNSYSSFSAYSLLKSHQASIEKNLLIFTSFLTLGFLRIGYYNHHFEAVMYLRNCMISPFWNKKIHFTPLVEIFVFVYKIVRKLCINLIK